MAKKAPIYFENDGSLASDVTQHWAEKNPSRFKPMPAETHMRLDLEFQYTGWKGWWYFKTTDGRKFQMAPTEVDRFIKDATIRAGSISGKFGFAKKGSRQSLVWLHE